MGDKITELMEYEIVKLYEKGTPIWKIALIFGVSENFVVKVIGHPFY